MKFILLFLLMFSASIMVHSQANYALFTLENTFPVGLSKNQATFYGISWKNDKASLNEYDFNTGQVVRNFNCELPENPIKFIITHPSKDILYLVTARKVDDTRNKYIDAIYALNLKRDKIELDRKVYYNYKLPNKVGVVGDYLVFTTLQDPTYLYDTKAKDFKELYRDRNYQLVSIAPSHNGFIMLNVNEVENGQTPIYFMDVENNLSNRIGFISKNLTIQSDKTTIQLPSLTFEDTTYHWIVEDIRLNCFPLYRFQIMMRPYWLKQLYELDMAYALSGILIANKTHLITRADDNISVYNYALPNSKMPEGFTEDDVAKFEEFLNERNNFDRELITDKALEQVYDAVFYKVYSKNKLKNFLVQFHGNYFEPKDYSELVHLLQPGFKLSTKEQANLFQETLDILYPVDAFNKKHITNYEDENRWLFVRGEAFEQKYGLELILNEAKEIIEIKYQSAIK